MLSDEPYKKNFGTNGDKVDEEGTKEDLEDDAAASENMSDGLLGDEEDEIDVLTKKVAELEKAFADMKLKIEDIA